MQMLATLVAEAQLLYCTVGWIKARNLLHLCLGELSYIQSYKMNQNETTILKTVSHLTGSSVPQMTACIHWSTKQQGLFSGLKMPKVIKCFSKWQQLCSGFKMEVFIHWSSKWQQVYSSIYHCSKWQEIHHTVVFKMAMVIQ